MAIFNLEYINEVYKSKYSNIKDDDDDEESSKDYTHLTSDEIRRITNLITSCLSNYPRLKKCCDYNDLYYRSEINDDGKRESLIDKYNRESGKSFIEILSGDVYSGYPDFKNDEDEYEKDCKNFVKAVNTMLEEKKIKAKFSAGKSKDDDVISFGIKSLKE